MPYDIQRAYNWAIQTCNSPTVGYSDSPNLRNQVTSNGITRYDCSSFIWWALKNGGWNMDAIYGTSYPFVTANMRGILINGCGFTELPIDSTEWKPGDIVLRILGEIPGTYGHTEMVYQSNGVGSGYTMGAHTDEVPLADQVSINASPSDGSRYRHLFRYGEGADPDSGYGASIYVVCAILGNWQQEGIQNPGQWEFGKPMAPPWDAVYPAVGGHGLGGWTNTGASNMRLLNLHNYLMQHGYDDNSGPGQLEFFIEENVWNYYPSVYQYASVYHNLEEFLKSTSTNLEDLTHAFNEGWEGIHDSSWDLRVEYARNAMSVIERRANDTSITEWKSLETNTSMLSVDDQENNMILIYRWLSSGGGGGGTPWKKKHMPVWMMVKYF